MGYCLKYAAQLLAGRQIWRELQVGAAEIRVCFDQAGNKIDPVQKLFFPCLC